MNSKAFRLGLGSLLDGSVRINGRAGLVTHVAATDARGRPGADLLREAIGRRLTCLLTPEHGYYGVAGAGESCRDERHPGLGIPVFSLYGRTRKPTARMLRRVDTLVVDLQDLGCRPYTYVATLRNVLEAAAEMSKRVIVADRPVPLPCVVDGPVTEKGFETFVASVRAPLCYGMTQAETALWLRATEYPDLDLEVAPMVRYDPRRGRAEGWPEWIPPSPAIVSWESAQCYPATVFCEGLGAIDCGRGTPMPFRVIGSPWMKGAAVCEVMTGLSLPGVRFTPHNYIGRRGRSDGVLLHGVRLSVTDPCVFRPVLTAVCLIRCMQDLHGRNRVWARPETRPDFFDKLFGTTSVREALLDGEDGSSIAGQWTAATAAFLRQRHGSLLYSRPRAAG